MTDEEMAEAYADEHSPCFKEYPKAPRGALKQAFLAGLKAGKEMAEADLATIAYIQGAERYKPKWHKVADGDYPPMEKGNYTINVLTDKGDIAYYSYGFACWIDAPTSAEIDTPVAWCEIPTFTEEQK